MDVVPVQAFVKGDFVVNLVPVYDTDTIDVVANKIAHHSVNRRVAPQDRPLQVSFHDEVLPNDATVSDVGIIPMDFLYASYIEE